MIPADFLELLRCPQNGQPLTMADAGTLARLNQRISQTPEAGEGVRNHAGTVIVEPLEEALLRRDQLLLYPVRGGIPVLLAEEAIPL